MRCGANPTNSTKIKKELQQSRHIKTFVLLFFQSIDGGARCKTFKYN